MNVFKTVITTCVISTAVFASNQAHALWGYRIDPPVAPKLTRTKYLLNPSVADIQQAIAPNTLVKISGTVNANGGKYLRLYVNDVALDFSNANQVNWSGNDIWEGFLDVRGSRIRVNNLRLNVNGPGRCRGVMIYSPATDLAVKNCEFKGAADGLVADGNWERVLVQNTAFLDCTNFGNTSMQGGYGIYMEDDDYQDDHVLLSNITITLQSNSAQHGIRLSKVQRFMLENSEVTANQKRSFWAYGTDRVAVRNTTFNRGSVLFNLMSHENYADRPVSRVRLDSINIRHQTILQPIGIYCSRGTTNFRMRDIEITSTSSQNWLALGWRGNAPAEKIRWRNGSIKFNGETMRGWQKTSVSDFSQSDLQNLHIGPIDTD